MLWFQAMFCIAPLLLASSISGASWRVWWRATEPKLRAWVAMFLASVATFVLSPSADHMPFAAYVCIDFLAGLAVLASPSGIYSRAIGVLFLLMVMIDAGAGYRGSDGMGLYQTTMLFLGWAMWAVLLVWGAHDAGKSLAAYYRGDSSAPPVGAHLASARQGSTGVIEP